MWHHDALFSFAFVEHSHALSTRGEPPRLLEVVSGRPWINVHEQQPTHSCNLNAMFATRLPCMYVDVYTLFHAKIVSCAIWHKVPRRIHYCDPPCTPNRWPWMKSRQGKRPFSRRLPQQQPTLTSNTNAKRFLWDCSRNWSSDKQSATTC